MRSWIAVLAAAGCGNDTGGERVDAPPAGTPFVTVSSPRPNEAFFSSETITVVWAATDDGSVTSCTAMASDGITSVPIATDVTTMTAMWSLSAVPLSNSYRVTVSCIDDAGLTGTGTSGMFSVTGPPQQVSYATQIQPLWNATCATMPCHDATQPQEGLNLTASASYAAIVGVPSTQCPTTQLVNPGNPAASYLMLKLQGNGPCLRGGRMPKTSPAYTPAQLQLVRDWIANGAPNN